ncbi:MAG TPA: hypothetical protein VF741_08770 [Candidatus Aquilonibacter sp.]
MTRPHEDRERHTAVNHKPEGSAVQFAPNAWCAIDVVHAKSGRLDAAVASYETLIEKARTSSANAGASVMLHSLDNHRVIVLVTLDGHGSFAHLKSAWDEHHLHAERHDVAESSTLALYHVVAMLGNVAFDPRAKNVYAVEHVGVDVQKARALAQTTAEAPGFRGALVFGNDDANASVLVYQFEHASEFAVVKTFD